MNAILQLDLLMKSKVFYTHDCAYRAILLFRFIISASMHLQTYSMLTHRFLLVLNKMIMFFKHEIRECIEFFFPKHVLKTSTLDLRPSPSNRPYNPCRMD